MSRGAKARFPRSLLAAIAVAAFAVAALRDASAQISTLLPFAKDWEAAATRAADERKLVLAVVQIYPGMSVPADAAVGCFLEPELLDLVRERFVPLLVTSAGEVPFADPDRYGMGPNAFGASALVATADGDVVAETFLVGNAAEWLDEFLRGVLIERAEDEWDGAAVADPTERARIHAQRGELDEALRDLRDVATVRAAVQRASIHRRLRDAAAARRELDRAAGLARRESSPPELLADLEIERASVATGTGELAVARAAYLKALAVAPSGPRAAEAKYELATLAWCEQDYELARNLFTEISRDHADGRWGLIAATMLTDPTFNLGSRFDPSWPSRRLFESLTLAPPAPAAAGDAPKVRCEAIERLLADQEPEGSWIVGTDLVLSRVRRPDALKIAVTAIAAQALLSERARPEVDAALRRAWSWLFAQLALARSRPRVVESMDYWPWAFAYATWLLADAVDAGFVQVDAVSEDAAGLVADLAARQQRGGGWSYLVSTDVADAGNPLHVSISFSTGAVVTALVRVRGAGIAVPAEMLDRAIACLERMRGNRDTFDYLVSHDDSSGVGPPQKIGASGRDPFLNHVLLRAGRGDAGQVERSLERFLIHLEALAREQGKTMMHCGPEGLGSHYVFFDYANTARVLAERGPPPSATRAASRLRDELRSKLRERVLAARLADGSFVDNPLIGRAYATAMAIQSLCFLQEPPTVFAAANAAAALPLDDKWPRVSRVEPQPLASHVRRLLRALESVGAPLPAADAARVAAALDAADAASAVAAIQEALDPHCLFAVSINPESRVKAARGPATPALVEQGWRPFLVKVVNEAGITAKLQIESPNAESVFRQENGADPPVRISEGDVRDRWCDLALYTEPPLAAELSGLALEYAIVQVHSRDAGDREARFHFSVGPGTADLGFRNELAVLFHAQPSYDVTLRVVDERSAPTIASFVFKDAQGRVYPLPSKRLAPDFFFHEQVYRADGESIRLPAGAYRVRVARGPAYLVQERDLVVAADAKSRSAEFQLERWIDPAARGWWSGDHHVHAAGCAHYTDPSRGVGPADMLRHVIGEDLDVGCVLSWGPCWYHQKSFFEGRVSELSTPRNLMRYDVEVSGFPSSYAGHLCLLGLTEDDYPGTTKIEEWPSFDLPVLQWGKSQGAVVGFSHSGFGLETEDKLLPSFQIPRFDGIGANEYVVDVTHDAVDFISAGDTPWPFELSIWYHTSNAGFRTRISGETDFPCIYGDRVGMGRVYAKLDGPLEFGAWLAAVKAGRSYVSEGRAHLFDFKVDDAFVGDELVLAAPKKVRVSVVAAARLDPEPEPEIAERPIDQQPWWSLERARLPGSRRVPVELVVNGQPVMNAEIEADGSPKPLEFDVPIERSSWIAVRILASAHSNPIYVVVGGKPIRASRRSVQWCLDAVDACWKSKSRSPELKAADRPACEKAYEHAREVYRRRLSECAAE